MSDVSAPSRSSQPVRRAAPQPTQRADPPAEDVRAMGEAFARARGSLPQGTAPARGGGKGAAMPAKGERAPDAPALGQWQAAAEERAALDRRDGDRHADQGFGGFAQNAAPVPVVVAAQAPAPHVDPSGFAQMLADLWTRENGRGPREVRVRFGAATWPATGARLVRSADGLLDVTVEQAPGTAAMPLAGLGTALAERGLAVGTVAAASA
ncbi:hypothetical protein [Sphingomonas corticis]|jgi:hypothetical protein|uniref:Flagellar hook-length control protein FliK n=1 Tax=Sphingomonas corticis TaxID=2722791 RepID=A0ABX1CMT7_9SPHN|nr:hypothetical protein [Sphingomonas corticis]NJR78496.1 hypothetical protein [Sphingomonas corticis]